MSRSLTYPRSSSNLAGILLMEELLHHLGCIKHNIKACRYWSDLRTSTGAGILPSTPNLPQEVNTDPQKVFGHVTFFKKVMNHERT